MNSRRWEDRPQTGKPRLHTSPQRTYEVLKPAALGKRRRQTPAERRMWQAVRNGNLGWHFRREHIIDGFIVDLLCIEAQLVIEIDGPSHNDKTEYDAVRQAHLEGCGYRVLRFSNADVMGALPRVIDQIRAAFPAVHRPAFAFPA